MNDHRDESLLDKIKNAFGMGDDGTDASPDDVRDDVPTPTTATTGATTDTMTPHTGTPRADFGEPFEEDLGDPVNRPAGPDYGATDGAVETGFGPAATRVDDGAGLDEGTAAPETGPRGTPAGYDDPYETVAGPGPMGGGTTDGDDAWTRGEAASGTSPFDGDERREGDAIERERHETGI